MRRVLWLLPLLLGGGGCLVDSQCRADYDCDATERCNGRTGQCFVECTKNSDCWTGGVDNGKQCVQHRCEFRFDERVAALGFCQPIVNPDSGRAGTQLCLGDLKGRVVLLYFGWVT